MSQEICSRCIVDTTVPGHSFGENGECAYCRMHDLLDREYPLTKEGEDKWERTVEILKRRGRGKPFDLVHGISGGRDSIYSLYLLSKKYDLRLIAVHFNDGFGNPVAGENMQKACDKLGVELRTITSDWRESKDIKIAFLKASTVDMEVGTDLGIATALYGTAAKVDCKYVSIGQSFRTEGVCPMEWNYLDGRYLKKVHQMFGTVELRKWTPFDPGFNLNVWHMAYYLLVKGIRTISPLYQLNYVRSEADEVLKSQLGWIKPGAHYFDDLYQSLMEYVLRTKFNVDRRKINYSALIRSGQMAREEALDKVKEPWGLEDPEIIRLCLKRLGISQEEFESFLALPPKSFRDYPTNYPLIKMARLPVWLFTKMGILPRTVYPKYYPEG